MINEVNRTRIEKACDLVRAFMPSSDAREVTELLGLLDDLIFYRSLRVDCGKDFYVLLNGKEPEDEVSIFNLYDQAQKEWPKLKEAAEGLREREKRDKDAIVCAIACIADPLKDQAIDMAARRILHSPWMLPLWRES